MSTLRALADTDTFPASRVMADALRVACRTRMGAKKPDDDALRELYREIGQRIRDARERKGWRREDLAMAVGVGFKSIVNYETGRPTLERITELADALDTTPRWLLHGEEAFAPLLESTAEGVQEIVRSQALIHGRLERLEALLSRPSTERTVPAQ